MLLASYYKHVAKQTFTIRETRSREYRNRRPIVNPVVPAFVASLFMLNKLIGHLRITLR